MPPSASELSAAALVQIPLKPDKRLAHLHCITQIARLLAERKGVTDARMQEFRWLVEELRTPQPVSD